MSTKRKNKVDKRASRKAKLKKGKTKKYHKHAFINAGRLDDRKPTPEEFMYMVSHMTIVGRPHWHKDDIEDIEKLLCQVIAGDVYQRPDGTLTVLSLEFFTS